MALPTPEQLDELAGRAWNAYDWSGESAWEGFSEEFQRGLRAQRQLFEKLEADSGREAEQTPPELQERPPLRRIDQRTFSDLIAHLYVTTMADGLHLYVLAGSREPGSLAMFGTIGGGAWDIPQSGAFYASEQELMWAHVSAFAAMTRMQAVLPGVMQGMGGSQPKDGGAGSMAMQITREEWESWGEDRAAKVAALERIALDEYRLSWPPAMRKPRMEFSIREGADFKENAQVFYAKQFTTE